MTAAERAAKLTKLIIEDGEQLGYDGIQRFIRHALREHERQIRQECALTASEFKGANGRGKAGAAIAKLIVNGH